MDATKDDQLLSVSSEDRVSRINAAVYDFLARRVRGEHEEIADFCQAHPDLQPELQTAMDSGVAQLRNVMDAARIDEEADASSASSHPPSDGDAPRWIRIKGYRATRIVSSGSQGTVFDAIQESTGKRVAIKVVQGFTRNSAVRFDREANTLAKLSHPGIANIIDRGRTADDAYFLVMDFIRGCDLDEWLKKLPADVSGQRTVVEMFILIARAIDAAHREGVVHRDLKPSNILIDEHGQPRIVDFGLVQLIAESQGDSTSCVTVTGNIVGSIPWSSPEQASGQSKEIQPATDVYAIGVLLYHALTGHFPYRVDGPMFMVTESICRAEPKRFREYGKLPFGPVQPALEHVLLKCLAKSGDDRFTNGGELANALQDCLRGTYRLPKSHRRKWKLPLAAMVVLGAVGLAMVDRKHSDASSAVVNLPMLTNSIGMKFVQLPAGNFRMGSDNDVAHSDNEQAHDVTISKPLFMDVSEVTRGQYLRVAGSLPDGDMQLSPNLPVDRVSRGDAIKFCEKLRAIDGRDYQLPTEAEWEYACRGNTARPTTGDLLETVGWFKDNSGGKLHDVCEKQPNHWGLFDMRGNVSEWVRDDWVASLGTANITDPIQQNIAGGGVTRGGSALDSATACRPASRQPEFQVYRGTGIGFRIMFR